MAHYLYPPQHKNKKVIIYEKKVGMTLSLQGFYGLCYTSVWKFRYTISAAYSMFMEPNGQYSIKKKKRCELRTDDFHFYLVTHINNFFFF